MAYFSHKAQNRDQWKVLANPAMKTLWYMTFTYILLRKLLEKNMYHRSCTFICGRLCSGCPEHIQSSNDKHQLNANPHLVTVYIIDNYTQY